MGIDRPLPLFLCVVAVSAPPLLLRAKQHTEHPPPYLPLGSPPPADAPLYHRPDSPPARPQHHRHLPRRVKSTTLIAPLSVCEAVPPIFCIGHLRCSLFLPGTLHGLCCLCLLESPFLGSNRKKNLWHEDFEARSLTGLSSFRLSSFLFLRLVRLFCRPRGNQNTIMFGGEQVAAYVPLAALRSTLPKESERELALAEEQQQLEAEEARGPKKQAWPFETSTFLTTMAF